MRAIDKKVWRELWNIRLQAIAIAMVIVGGIGIFIMSLSTLDSLTETRARFYRDYHFADVFTSLKRAPDSVVTHIAAIPGIDKIETRVMAYVNLDVTGFDDPVSAHLVSLPDNSPGLLNQVYLRQGRLPTPGNNDEVLVSEKFAQAHDLRAGDRIGATINGRHKWLTIVGLALSPEFIYQIAPGAMFPDNARYGILWMPRKPLATAYDMDGAFNNVSVTLGEGVNEQEVIDALDDILAPWGGIGAYGRHDQFSNRFLSEELKQQRTLATIFPVIFFGVAAFLLNVVISRLISLEREQIAILKAFGYSNLEVGIHYAKLVATIVALGIVAGTGVGIWMGKGLSNLYMDFFSLPFMIYVLRPGVVIAAAAMSMAIALLGTTWAVRRAVLLPPAQAMRPEIPVIYRTTFVERLGIQHWFNQPTRMVLRHIERRPLKSFMTMLGIALACGTMMVGRFQEGAIDFMVDVQYRMSRSEDLIAIFTEPTSAEALYSLHGQRYITLAEGFRDVPARLAYQHYTYRTAVLGVPEASSMMRLLDVDLKPIDLPAKGIVLTDYLADILHIKTGDVLQIEILESSRRKVSVPVAAISREYLGANAYMQRTSLNELLDEGNVISGALLRVADNQLRNVYRELRQMPRVAGVVEQRSAVQSFYDTLAESILFFTFVATLLGGSIAFGVVYNSMRIALSERNRELASLRVLGFRRGEIAWILLGEMALLTLAAIPVGFAIGYGLCAYMAWRFDTDLYRVPLVLHPDVYAFAASVVLVSAIASAIMIWRNLGDLDMVAVLKTKE